jgi:glycolate oxidase
MNIVESLKNICGERHVYTDKESLYNYERDETLDYRFPFDILVKPGTAGEISAILQLCNQHKIPVTPRAGGTGVTGGALPVSGGIVLSIERLNRILHIDRQEKYVITEPGVICGDLCEGVKNEQLYFPLSPGSRMGAMVGGNVAENSGAINSCKFGSVLQNVINLEVVLPTGEIIWTGSNVAKSATGLNLTQLFVGSEGILGVITKVVYRLLPPFLPEILFLAAFDNLQAACETVMQIRSAGIIPSAVELIGKKAITCTAAFLRESLPLVTDNVEALLLIGLKERDMNCLQAEMEKLETIFSSNTDMDILVGQTEPEKDKLYRLRSNIGNAMTSGNSQYRDVDACVPLKELYNYLQQVEIISSKYQLEIISFGHAMDGNMHTMLLPGKSRGQVENAASEIYKYAISIGGVISGEHGIGFLQKEYLHLQFNREQLQLMKKIKFLFDPNGIMNPGKMF